MSYYIECMVRWWRDLSYTTWMYFGLLLPVTILVYQFVPRKYRRLVLLLAGWLFFYSLSGLLLAANIGTSVFVWIVAGKIEAINTDRSVKREVRRKKKRRVLALSVVTLILVIICFKYLDLIGLNIVRITQFAGIPFDWHILGIAAPIGISYYTLESIAYISDVYGEKIPAEKSLLNMCLFMSFFPKLVEGPITRYGEAEKLFAGDDIYTKDVAEGYQRILWGLFKKMCIADHLAPAVSQLFDGEYMDGGVAIFAALLFTIQEYMDFSGTIDIGIGSARVFGIKLSENFRQPFFAKNASDFWRRWHITLGTFFRDYIFYPIALTKTVAKITDRVKASFGKRVSRFASLATALFFVWFANGIWHGPRLTYVFYGMYFFVIILIEDILEEPFLKLLDMVKLKETSIPVRIFRFLKLSVIVLIGEMFFRAYTFGRGLLMFKMILTNLRFDVLIKHLQDIGIDRYGYFVIITGLIVVLVVDTLKEAGISLREKLAALPLPARFAFWYVCIFFVIIFGAYGTGYDTVDLIYAQF